MTAASPLRELAGLCGQFARPAPEVPVFTSSLDALCATAQAHEVAGLFAIAAAAGRAGPLEDHWLEGLLLYLEQSRIEARMAEDQLASLLDLFATHGLQVIPFKGPALARSAYADAGARTCRDLDVLVRSADVAAALTCLVDSGFVHEEGLDRRGIAALRRYAGEYILFRPGALPVEPHWHPAPRTLAFDIDLDAIWAGSVAGNIKGAPCRLLAPRDHLLLLALHGAKEQWHKLKWIADIDAFLASHPSLDMDALRTSAEEQGCRRIVDLALLLSQRLFDSRIDLDHDAATSRLADRVVERLEATATAPGGPYRLDAFYWQIRERMSDRVRYAWRTAFTPRVAHYRRLPLPAGLRWMHVPVKPVWDYLVTPAVRWTRRRWRRPS